MNKIKNALLLDDEDLDLYQYKRLIQKTDLIETAEYFELPDSALDRLIEKGVKHYDVIFTDINMPRMNGFEFIQAANEQLGDACTDIIFVILTTSLHPNDKAHAERLSNILYYFEKPLTKEHLELVASAVQLSKRRVG